MRAKLSYPRSTSYLRTTWRVKLRKRNTSGLHVGEYTSNTFRDTAPGMEEKGESRELEDAPGSNDEIDRSTNHHSWDNHTSFNKYPTHEPGFENKVTFGFFMTMLGFSLSFCIAEVIPLFLITIFTVIAYDLGDGDKAIWLLVAQFIAVGSIVPFVGPLIDLIGRKSVTLLSLGLTVVSMILMGTTQNIAGMIGAMAISGIAIGIQLLTAVAAVTELVPTYKRGITIGYIVMGFMPFAPASLYGQLLAEHSWRYNALVIGVLALIALVIITIWYKPPPRPAGVGMSKRQVLARMDFVGAFLGIGGITVFLVGLNWGGQDYPWSSAHVISTLTVGLASLVAFGIWEKYGAKHPMFPWRLAVRQKRIFCTICFLCVTSGINYVPVVVFWTIQLYTVYGASFRQAGIYLLPIGFCIAGGAIISAVLMTVFKRRIQWVLLFFCIIQTAGLGSMAAIDPENIKTAWGPLIVGLIGVGGVLLPSQVVFSIISPDDLIGTSVSLSIVVRAIGQVVGVSMFYNVFKHQLTDRATNDPSLFALPALANGLTVSSPAALVPTITDLITALAAGPFSSYAYLFPGIDTPAQIAAVQLAGHNLYKGVFPLLYLIAIAWGAAACIACLFLTGLNEFINDHVAVVL
ncbi:Efflux pump FUS6 [Hyphodiscus hymeniophilus]|uniref:Efflux pump FUS6 n=1 Tax=Hyphodiscus hymeniophilus TaxID=353542 RepID=A0A9P6VKX8_9HELO|nr:Efflux pump FUS6 [Hyphodiscus hymeniophilus]